MILDVFSRYVVGWAAQCGENGELAKALIEQATEQQQQITAKVLTLHSDRGAPVRQAGGFLLADLGVTKAHSRPHTSSDSPYSESNFKTLKCRPEFPERFADIEHARAHCRQFCRRYSHQHRHCGMGLMTRAALHHGGAPELHAVRGHVRDASYARNPERFVRKPPVPPDLPTAVWINKPKEIAAAHSIRTQSVSPDLTGSVEPTRLPGLHGHICLRRALQTFQDVSVLHPCRSLAILRRTVSAEL